MKGEAFRMSRLRSPRRWVLLLLFIILPGFGNGAVAQTAAPSSSDKGILTFQFENDLFGNTDQHFTHGTRLAWMSPEDDVPGWVRNAASYVPVFDVTASKRIVYSLAQSIYTPDDISTRVPDPNDRPYAGWLYASIGLVSVTSDRLDNLQLDLGVVGPHSYAEQVQRTWHGWFGFQKPQGWDNQLHDEPGIVLSYDRKWRRWARFNALGLDGDISPHVGASVGNVLTDAGAGFTLRLGSNLARDYDYGPPLIRPSLPGSDYFVSNRDIGWYVFLGAEGRGVLRNITLDGNTFRSSPSVDKYPFVGDVQGGVAVIVGRVRMAYTHVFRTREFHSQDHADIFGAFSVSIMF